jgi:uncharacterized damage-inducible protein DinB
VTQEVTVPFEMATHVAALDLNTRLALNALRDLSDDEARRRLFPGVNSAAFIAAHLVDARHYLLKLLGAPRPNPMDALGEVKNEDEVAALPPLGELRAAWLEVGGWLRATLVDLTEEEAAREVEQQFPLDLPGALGAVVFLLHHESYHVGQLGLLRRQLGHPAMSYAPAPETSRSS